MHLFSFVTVTTYRFLACHSAVDRHKSSLQVNFETTLKTLQIIIKYEQNYFYKGSLDLFIFIPIV